jgi:hypothetical protein
MREIRLSGSVEGVVSNHDPYADAIERKLTMWPGDCLPLILTTGVSCVSLISVQSP